MDTAAWFSCARRQVASLAPALFCLAGVSTLLRQVQGGEVLPIRDDLFACGDNKTFGQITASSDTIANGLKVLSTACQGAPVASAPASVPLDYNIYSSSIDSVYIGGNITRYAANLTAVAKAYFEKENRDANDPHSASKVGIATSVVVFAVVGGAMICAAPFVMCNVYHSILRRRAARRPAAPNLELGTAAP